MKRILPVLVVGIFGACTAAAQSSASVQAGATAQSQTSVQPGHAEEVSSSALVGANAASDSANISAGTKVNATLANSLDAKKCKPGDRVEARTTEDVKQGGQVLLKKGTHLVGHVAEAQARESGQAESQLGIVFDHAVLKSGQVVPFRASIQALAAAQSSLADDTGSNDNMAMNAGMGAVSGTARGGGGLVGGVASTAGTSTGSVVNTASSVPVNAGGALSTTTRSSGAIG
jgi:hypothetical protein